MRSIAIMLAAVIVLASLAACSSSSSTKATTSATTQSSDGLSAAGSAGLAKAKADLEGWQREPTSIELTTPIGKPIPTGKKISAVFAANGSANLLSDPLKAAGKALGWDVKVSETQFTPEAIQSNFAQAVRDKPDAFVYAGFPGATVSQSLSAFAAAKTPVVAETVAETTDASKNYLVLPSPDVYALDGQMLAASITVATGGKGKLMLVTVPAFEIYAPVVAAVNSNLKSYCPDCALAQYDMPAESIGKDSATRITNYIQGHPGINGLVDVFGAFSIGLPTALQGAGIDPKSLKTVALYPPTQVIGMVKQGAVFAAIPFPFDEYMFTAVDAIARLLVGESFSPDVTTAAAKAPAVVWTQANAPANTDTTAGLPIIKDYEAKFRALWGK